MSRKALHVVMVNLRWAVIRVADGAAISTHDRKEDAVSVARAIAARDDCELVVFDIGGRPQPFGNEGPQLTL